MSILMGQAPDMNEEAVGGATQSLRKKSWRATASGRSARSSPTGGGHGAAGAVPLRARRPMWRETA
eukprot:8658715-Alexandrium_andersonii.AAC.1